jgi:hypothetical protein
MSGGPPLVSVAKILIGFSKGVVVLNQILHELSTLQGRVAFHRSQSYDSELQRQL